MAARARRARQLVGKEIFRCYQCILLLYSLYTSAGHWILRIEGSAEHSRCTCVDRPSRSHHEQFRTQGSAHRAY